MNDWQAILRRYKTAYASDPEALSIRTRTKNGEIIRLRPLQAQMDLVSIEDVRRLRDWRNRNPQAFLTELAASDESTRRYAVEVVGRAADRILFFVEDDRGHSFGHAGLDHIDPSRSYAELDNVVRGEGGPRGGMRAAVEALCAWARRELDVADIWVHVLADNPAAGFYEHIGFERRRVVSLRPTAERPGIVRWIETSDALPAGAGRVRQLLIMERPAA